MEIRDLKYFVKLCEMRSFSKAADNLYITQPTLSKSVKRLEKELEAPILDHSITHFKLTEIGQKMYKRAKNIIDDFEQMIAELKVHKQQRETIRIGALPYFGAKDLSLHILEFENLYPSVDIEIQEGALGSFFEQLNKKQIDFIYTGWPINIKFFTKEEIYYLTSTEFHFHQLYQSKLYFAICKSNPLIMKKNISLEDIKDQKIIICSEAVKKGFSNYYKNLGIQNVKFITVPEKEDIHRLVMQDEGVAIIHEDFVVPSKNIVHTQAERTEQGLLALKHASESYAKKQFIDMLRNKFSSVHKVEYVS